MSEVITDKIMTQLDSAMIIIHTKSSGPYMILFGLGFMTVYIINTNDKFKVTSNWPKGNTEHKEIKENKNFQDKVPLGQKLGSSSCWLI